MKVSPQLVKAVFKVNCRSTKVETVELEQHKVSSIWYTFIDDKGYTRTNCVNVDTFIRKAKSHMAKEEYFFIKSGNATVKVIKNRSKVAQFNSGDDYSQDAELESLEWIVNCVNGKTSL